MYVSAQEGDAKVDPKTKTWQKEQKGLKYQKAESYKGPNQWGSSGPSDIKDHQYDLPEDLNGSSGSGTIRYRPQQVQQEEKKSNGGYNRGGGRGTLKYDPKIKRPEPISAPDDMTAPDINPPNTPDLDVDAPSTSQGFWKILLIIVLIVAAMLLVFFLVRNKKPADKKVVVDVENDWNPEVITKTELELRLEAAMANEDFRECVRIYFTFILKELIKKGWIQWKKEKTNHHYVMEMGTRAGTLQLMECVRIYDLVWYGEYQIDREIFEMLQPSLLNYYKSLDPKDE